MARHRGTEMMRLVDRYVSERRRLGFNGENEAYSLRSFARYAGGKGETTIRSATAVEWSAQGPSRLARHTRLLRVIRLAKYLRAEEPEHEIPSADHFRGPYSRPKPYIYSAHEIGLLMRSASRLGPRGGLRASTFKALIGLLAATGMRAGEARHLLLDDVLREQKALFIRGSKCKKRRLIPIHASTLLALDAYIAKRRRLAPAGEHLFVTSRGTGLLKANTDQTFARVRCCLGPRRQTPRLHDLRHTFAVRALEACPTEGRDRIGRHMRAISQYLGHTKIRHTYWYFEATPKLMKSMADAARQVVEQVHA
jgi:integrase/recombinase XerD